MWKNLKNKDRQAEIAIEGPMEINRDGNVQQGATNINDGSFSISSRPAFGRKRTEDVLKGLPTIPFNKLHVARVTNGRPSSEAATSSSIYSQPSPELHKVSTRKNGHECSSSPRYPDDVSPPKSPYILDGDNGRSRKSSPEVSPVSDSPSPLANRSPVFASGRYNSNIPIAKKTHKFWNRPSTDSPDRGSSLTHWDVYSGEPTTREKGEPPQTTPGAVKLSAEPSLGRLNGNVGGFGTSTHISGGGSTIGRKKVASRDPKSAPIVRPEWRGPGGRHKIVNPLLDKPLPPGMSPTFPAGSDKNQRAQKHQDRTVDSSTRSQSPHQLTNKPIRPSIILNDKELGLPVTSSGSLNGSSANVISSPAFQQNSESRIADLSAGDVRSPLARNPSNEEIKDHQQSLPGLPQNTVKEAHSPCLRHIQQRRSQVNSDAMMNGGGTPRDPSQAECGHYADPQFTNTQDQPHSRFNSTAYSTIAYDSPLLTPGSTSPAVSIISATPNSILNRKRPVPPAGVSNSKVTARKPTPSDLGTPKQIIDSKRKSLPKSPPEAEATSRTSSLRAKLDNLHQRKRNLETVIHELTSVVQPSSIAYDMASRQEIKKTVEGLGRELAEVVKDEHDTGLKLHRALKRDDEFAAYEPTSIWVRRVTS